MQFFRHFLLLPYKNRYKRTIFCGAKFNKTFPKINIETKQCYIQIPAVSTVLSAFCVLDSLLLRLKLVPLNAADSLSISRLTVWSTMRA
jgi:hypothetical protein